MKELAHWLILTPGNTEGLLIEAAQYAAEIQTLVEENG